MRRTLVVVNGLLGSVEDESPLRQNLPALTRMRERARLARLNKLPELLTPESVWLGMNPAEGQMRDGPLTVAAFGADPPARSMHFHLSLLSYADGKAEPVRQLPQDEEYRQIVTACRRLDTKTLTMVEGEGADHGLVWEDVGDMLTRPASELIGKSVSGLLPEGDGEVVLRRYIDDSLNMLSDLDCNRRRVDEGLQPINLLWPWGDGLRMPVPNLLFRRGERAQVESGSLRLAGLCRLVGYRHGDRLAVGRGVKTQFEHLAQRALAHELSLVVLDAPAELREAGKLEELFWLTDQFDKRCLEALVSATEEDKGRLALFAPGPSGGLCLILDSAIGDEATRPFDERSLDDNRIPAFDTWSLIEKAMLPV